jgi:hypothetical protein
MNRFKLNLYFIISPFHSNAKGLDIYLDIVTLIKFIVKSLNESVNKCNVNVNVNLILFSKPRGFR